MLDPNMFNWVRWVFILAILGAAACVGFLVWILADLF